MSGKTARRAADLDRVRLLLESRRADASRRLAEAISAISAIADAREAANADDEHDPEGATLAAEWSRLAGIRDGVERERREIDVALARSIGAASGACVDCGADIPIERLLVRPSATRCVACAVASGG